jgi:hypothetical protein
MGYYQRGDYYGRGDWMPGRGDVLSMLKRGATALLPAGAMVKQPGQIIPTIPQIAKATVSGVKQAFGFGDAGSSTTRRRMNPLNPRALRRALRRAQGFARFARKTMHFVHPRPHSTRFKFPKRRKR